MKFLIPDTDVRLYSQNGYGPFSEDSRKLISNLDGSKRQTVELDLYRENPPFSPRMLRHFGPPLFYLKAEACSDRDLAILNDAVAFDVFIQCHGQFLAFSMERIEEQFLNSFDLQRSRISLIKGASIERKGGPRVVEEMSGVGSIEELEERRQGILPMRQYVINEGKTKSSWEAGFFVFDGLLYVSAGWDLYESGFIPTDNRCEILS